MDAPARSIPPSRSPCGLVFRVYVGGELLAEDSMTSVDVDQVEALAQRHVTTAQAAMADRGVTDSRVYIYDGDSGTCVGTLIVT